MQPARAAPDACRGPPRLPAAYDDALAAGLAALGLVLTPASGPPSTATSPAPRLDPGDQPDGHPRPVEVARARPRQPDGGPAASRPWSSTPSSTSAPAAACPESRWRSRFRPCGLLVESIGKKARFLETAVAAVAPVTTTPHASCGSPSPGPSRGPRPDRAHAPLAVVTARAVAALPDLVELGFPLLGPGGGLVAWKRGDLAAELAAGGALDALGGGARRVPVDAPGARRSPAGRRHRAGRACGLPARSPARARRPW